MSRILGIDYGQVRTGIAISDELQITAQGLETIVSNGSDKVLLRRIAEIVDEYKVDKIVIGNPINLDGTESERSIITDKFVHKLKSRFNKIEIIKIDERLTTVEAHRTMNFLNVKNREKKNLVDTVAATYILETYLNSIKKA
jgi:putative Holliday junction resolvase